MATPNSQLRAPGALGGRPHQEAIEVRVSRGRRHGPAASVADGVHEARGHKCEEAHPRSVGGGEARSLFATAATLEWLTSQYTPSRWSRTWPSTRSHGGHACGHVSAERPPHRVRGSAGDGGVPGERHLDRGRKCSSAAPGRRVRVPGVHRHYQVIYRSVGVRKGTVNDSRTSHPPSTPASGKRGVIGEWKPPGWRTVVNLACSYRRYGSSSRTLAWARLAGREASTDVGRKYRLACDGMAWRRLSTAGSNVTAAVATTAGGSQPRGEAVLGMLFPGESSTWDMGHVGNTRPTTGSLALSDCSNPFNTINLFTAVCAKVVPYVLVLTLRRQTTRRRTI